MLPVTAALAKWGITSLFQAHVVFFPSHVYRHAGETDYDEEASGVMTRRTNLAKWSLRARNSPILRSTVCLSFNAVAIRANSSSSCTGLVRKSSAPALMP